MPALPQHPFADLALARRLEGAEAKSNADFVDARARVRPESEACRIEVEGTYALFDGVDSPLTQTFGLGVFSTATEDGLRRIEEFMRELGTVTMACRCAVPLFAEIDGAPVATGSLNIHDGVALFAGASTAPEYRRRGAQNALLSARLRLAVERGCDLAMMVALPGSNSQKNAERAGFRVAYTRTKWQLAR